MDVINGTVEIVFLADDGTTASVSLTAGNGMSFYPGYVVATASPDNTETAIVTVEGISTSISPGQTVPLTTPQCGDGLDNDGDGFADFPDDVGCTGAEDLSEVPDCDDGLDNNSDLLTDFPDDPGCFNAAAPSETTACDDGLDNDGDGYCDMPTSTCDEPGVTPGDPWCEYSWDGSEHEWRCGLGFELALLLPSLMWLRGRRRRGLV